MNMHEGTRTSRKLDCGFTLVELLVVVAVIALLIGVLLPALSKARMASQSAVGMSNVRQLALAQASYASRSDDWLAGPNTSGASGIVKNGKNYEFATSSSTPTSTHDWISPCLGEDLNYSPNRAERTLQIFERFRCPRAGEVSKLYIGGTTPGDKVDFEKIQNERGGFGQVSYLAPASFMYSGPRPSGSSGSGDSWAPRLLLSANKKPLVSYADPFRVPVSYRPQLSAIKNSGTKVCVADGTRYVAQASSFGGTTLLDFDYSAAPSIYGSFTESPPPFDSSTGSVAYSRTYGKNIREFNVDLSMRFPTRQMHAAFFDGHAERITGQRAWSDPGMWFPTGSEYTGQKSTPEISKAWKVTATVP